MHRSIEKLPKNDGGSACAGSVGEGGTDVASLSGTVGLGVEVAGAASSVVAVGVDVAASEASVAVGASVVELGGDVGVSVVFVVAVGVAGDGEEL